ncbi:DapH/DapD/GlmU-related protein [Ectopseudomonas oleovorans]|uniref:acyltransferase n=1 Tax=Ectopseudomonas oleovorans TaxID=301 RepID=UPI0012FE8717|nr:acyltransferase [Pseudomonas oleovorans]
MIGDDVIMGPGVRIISTTHDVSDPDKSFACQPLINKRVQIGSNVWIGANVVILAGVCIESNVVVGAGALVTQDLESGGVYVGAPSRRVKDIRSNR